MDIKIRRTDDLQAVHEVDRLTFPLDKPTLEREPTHEWWLAESQGDPIAFIGLSLGSQEASITRVGVVPAYRGAGLQKRLCRVVMRYAKSIGVPRLTTYVMANNIPSLRSLLAVGFKPYKTSTDASGKRLFLELETRLT